MVALGARAVRVSAGAFALLLLAGVIGTAGLSYVAADKLIHPERELRRATPAHRGLEYERVIFGSEDGVPLVGWWMPAEESPGAPRACAAASSSGGACGVVVFLHGYGASKWQSLSVAPFLVASGFDVLAFDFRAHGESGGRYTTVGLEEARDVRAAVRYAQGIRGAEAPIALLGWSMGAAAALHAADELPEVRAIVADSGFASLSAVVGSNLARFTGLPDRPFVPIILFFASHMAGHDPADNSPAVRAAMLGRPLLVIQGTQDDIARPDRDGGALAAAGGERAQLWLVDGAGHVDARRAQPREYESRVVAFLTEALA